MSRPIAEDDLHAFVDGALAPARRAEVEAFLEKNPEIANRFGRFAEHRVELRSALAPIAAEPIPPQLNLAHLIAARRPARWAKWSSMIAACLLLLIGGAGGWLLRGDGAAGGVGIEALADEAAYAYAVFGTDRARAVEIPAADGPMLARWMENRLRRRVTMPDLARRGFRLMGGRVVATRNGPAGLLMYDDARGLRIAILMRPMIAQDRSARMAFHRQGDVVGFTWADRGMGYGLMGTASAGLLHPLADEARRQFQSKARA
ncbi:anti-sigma factor family protein [Sphingomonas alpina]|uniref:Anti-sigma factor n=1 Tax=Sphingomonas alpina TaxID=653931 RepID=A0A7H0LL73_9SPHN|nr:anti-sigma factor [Sphingomonas alpina]QNQ10426.1 anti-sigma factor [Sphingomonas alpina]